MEAVIAGLSHPDPAIRRGCAEFMDDHGTEASVEPLLHVAQHDPIAWVRRAAAHSLGCQRCKACPVQVDLVAPLVEIALSDASPGVRREAVGRLGELPPDPRAAAALQTILSRETGRQLWNSAHWALKRHDSAAPEPSDLAAPLIEKVLTDARLGVRRDAARCLGHLAPDPRIAAALRTVLSRETDRELLFAAHQSAMRQDEEYRQAHIASRRTKDRAASPSL
jgi:HEAT repeat protein